MTVPTGYKRRIGTPVVDRRLVSVQAGGLYWSRILKTKAISWAEKMSGTVCRGVRGATTVEANHREDILAGTRQMLALMIRRNDIDPNDVCSAIFTVTKDIDAEFPALAARQLGWLHVPLLCGYEISVEGSLPLCIRVLIHWNTIKSASEIEHVYMRGAERLRPDLCTYPPADLDELEAWIAEQMQNDSRA